MTLTKILHESLLENMHAAVLLLDGNLHLQYMNAAAESLLEMSAQRYEGMSIDHLFSENGSTPEGLLKALESKQQFTKRETILRLPIPMEITVDYTVTPINDNNLWLLMEIQPLNRALKISQEKMLLSSQVVSRTLIRGLAHEIKNPLGGLRGAAQLLERQLDDPELKEYTAIIIREADRLRNLVDRMLGPHKKFHIEHLNIHEVLEHIRKLIIAETESRILIHTDYDPSLPKIDGDREQLIQALLNIARNAMQALAKVENPEITFRTRIQRKFTIGNTMHRLVLRIDIIDNGIGIPPEITENVFFPMVTGRSGGTGLGLSISQSIISQHQGLIKFESQPGNTVFSLFLPLEQNNHERN
jgi:two-component system, NtrC family, nitrogen regulation sensor histidine kinase GlnL